MGHTKSWAALYSTHHNKMLQTKNYMSGCVLLYLQPEIAIQHMHHKVPTDYRNKVASMMFHFTSILWLSFLQTRTIWLQTLLTDFTSTGTCADSNVQPWIKHSDDGNMDIAISPQWLTKNHQHRMQQAQRRCTHYKWLNGAKKRNHSTTWNWTQCQTYNIISGTLSSLFQLGSHLPTDKHKKSIWSHSFLKDLLLRAKILYWVSGPATKAGSTILSLKQGHKAWNGTMLHLQWPEQCPWRGKLWELSSEVLVEFMPSEETINPTHYI
jgi:hypothetical protein